MADNKLQLPGKFQAGKRYLMKGETLLEWKKQIEADRAVPGAGLVETDSGVGRLFRVIFPPSEYPPFALREARKDGADYELLFEPGRVIIANPVQAANAGDGYDYFVPEINGDPMDEELPNGEFPKLTIAPGDGVYCKIERNEQGLVVPPVQLVVDAQNEDSDHYQPEDPIDAGSKSEFDLIRILYFDIVDGEIEIKVWRESDIELTPFLWTGENVGGYARVFKEHAETEGVYKFRTPRGCWGASVEEDGDVIKIEADGKNVGDDAGFTPGTGASLLIEKADEDPALDKCEEAFKIKSLHQGADADEKQIRITNEGDKARVHGNGVNGSLTLRNCGGFVVYQQTWEDGLITTSGDFEATLGECSGSAP